MAGSYRSSNRPMVGGGWVVTHEDVTLLKKNEAALQEALEDPARRRSCWMRRSTT